MRQIELALNVGTVSGLTDRQLLEEFASPGDPFAELAFAAIVHRHGPMVLRVCRSILKDHHDSEDAFQATFLILARKANTLWVQDSLGPWLNGVACRVAGTARKAAIRRRAHEHRAASLATTAESYETPQDIGGIVHEEIARLPERYRAPVVLCDLEEYTYEDAARTLGWPIGTIKSRLARGRQRLRSRLLRRGIAPSGVLLASAVTPKSQAAVPSALIDATAHLAARLGAGRATAMVTPTTVRVLMEGVLKKMFLSKLKTATAFLLVGCGILSSATLWIGPATKAAGPFGDPIQQVAQRSTGVETEEPAPAKPPMPAVFAPARPGRRPSRPWETVVRIKVIQDHATGFGSGTIIQSTSDASIILTAAHHFQVPNVGPPGKFPYRIQVNLFDAKLEGDPPRVHRLETVAGELMDYRFDLDIALVRIRPGRRLVTARIVPRLWQPRWRMKMQTIGCSEGQDATLLQTTITNPRTQGFLAGSNYIGIECRTAPKQGRSGGGLFTTDDYLAGVCNYAEPKGNHGLYATPRSIYTLLDRNNLTSLYTSTTVPEEQLDDLIHVAEDQLENHERELLDRTLERLRALIEERRAGLNAELETLDAVYSRRIDELSREEAVDGERKTGVASPSASSHDRETEPLPSPVKAPPRSGMTDHERRLGDVEQKLERILKILEETRGGRTPDR